MTKQKPRLPEVGEYVRGIGTLVKVEDVTPKPPPKETDYIFEEVTAHCEIRFGEQVLQEFNNVRDFHGKEASVEDCVMVAKSYCTSRHVGPQSELEVVVVKEVEYRRKRPRADRDNNLYAPEFLDFQALDHGCKWEVPPPTSEVVWSSRGVASERR